MTPVEHIRTALVSVLNSEARARLPALRCLAYVKYPKREVKPLEQPDGSYNVDLAIRGYEYKARSRPISPPVVDPVEVRIALNGLLPNGLYVSKVVVQSTHIEITVNLY